MRRFVLLAALTALVACTTSRTVAGRFDSYDEVLYGRMNSNLLGGGGRILVQSRNAGLWCTGRARVAEGGPSWFSCADQIGTAEFTCSDGRTAKAIYTMTSCKSGHGAGVDSTGAQLRFVFGMSEADAAAHLDRSVREQARSRQLRRD
jgi:hypothetical protein